MVVSVCSIMDRLPTIIQGGMGAGVSSWRLAQAVSKLGQLGVVSGTALDVILARRLQDGDPAGHMRRGLDRFPIPEMAERIWRTYYIPGGKAETAPYKSLPTHSKDTPLELQELYVVANFVEVILAREGHDNPVGINYLEKVQLPHLPSIYGAMLAGVGYVLMGAGVPLRIPGVLDRFSNHEHTYELPPGAVQLARSERYEQQAFVFANAYALQFHLELTPALVAECGAVPAYAASLERLPGGRSLDGLLEQASAVEPTAVPLARALFARWLERVVGVAS